MIKDVDILIVGSGPGGAMMAHELSKLNVELERPLTILVMESGPQAKIGWYNQKELDMSVMYQDRTNRFTSDRSTQIIQGHVVGGGSLLYTGTAHPPPDYILKSWGRDFGLTDYLPGNLHPHYKAIEEILPIDHHDNQHIWNDNNRYFWEALKAEHLKRKAIRRFVRSCAGVGFCYYGCQPGRKSNAMFPLLHGAMNRGVEIMANCHVEQLIYDSNRKRVCGAYAWQSEAVPGTVPNRYPSGPIKVNAKLVVVSGGPINTPTLLLRSHLPGLSSAVGRYFIAQSTNTINILMPFKVNMIRGLPKTGTCFEYQESHGLIITPSQIHPLTTAVDVTGFGEDYLEAISRFDQLIQWQLFTFDAPHASNRIRVANGKPVIEYTYTPEYIDRMLFGMRTVARLALSDTVRAERVYIGPTRNGYLTATDKYDLDQAIHKRYWRTNRWNLNTAHPQGSCRMGTDPSNSVVNPKGRVHNVNGLMVVDTSLYPTSAHTNPVYAMYSIAHKIAQDTKRDIHSLLGQPS